MSKNMHLSRTRKVPNDEFYTTYSDIEQEFGFYNSSFAGKIVYCNCDDEGSQFRSFFTDNFEQLGLQKLICTGISGEHFEFDGNATYTTSINGDFRSDECQAVMDSCDIVITNPPYSLFNGFISTIAIHEKDFLVIGPKSAVSYSSVFPMFHDGRCRIGYTAPNYFTTPSGDVANLQGMSRWFTSLPTPGKKYFTPTASINEREYQRFDLYPATNVDKTSDIPCDHDGLMGIPITAIEKINPSEYELVDLIARYALIDHTYDTKDRQLTEIGGKARFSRLIIKKIDINKQPLSNFKSQSNA